MSFRVPTPDSRASKWLIGYFGVFQLVHVLVNLRALDRFAQGLDTFPANPPADGWTDETQATFKTMAEVDTLAGLLTIAFVVDYARDGEDWPLFGAVALTLANYSAALYAVPTRRAGAWDEHPLAYWGLYLVYVPVVVLSVLYAWWAVHEEL